jgi:hypothetical protein
MLATSNKAREAELPAKLTLPSSDFYYVRAAAGSEQAS